MGFLGDFFKSGLDGVLDGASSIIDKFVESPEEKNKAKAELLAYELEYKKQAMQAELEVYKDRQSARDMFKDDSSLQKIFAITFLVGYIGLTGVILYFLFNGTLTGLENWAVALISSIFTAMSTKVATICDFLFGGSSKPSKGNSLDLSNMETKKK